MAKLTVKQIEKLIYPVSFYRYKARYIKATCAKLIKDFGGKTPTTMEELLTLPGVGRKTANLVLILAYQSQRNICVDTHVHRIANRLGWVRTKTPDETEQALYKATRRSLVAVHQFVSGDVGPERLQARLSRAARRARSVISARASASRKSAGCDFSRAVSATKVAPYSVGDALAGIRGIGSSGSGQRLRLRYVMANARP